MLSTRPAALAVLLVLAMAVPVRAVTLHDIVELTKAGLSEDVIVALLEADQTQFTLDARQIIELRSAGVSDRVILAMLTSRPKNAVPPAPALQPAPVALRPEARSVPIPVPYPVYLSVPVFSGPSGPVATLPVATGLVMPGRFINDGFTSIAAQPTPTAAPWKQAVDPRDIWVKRPRDGAATPPRP